ncbi:MAG: hypothetical protein LBF74_02955 [Treponema sp.]|nr:hypothetical protein [Treponema sp.]
MKPFISLYDVCKVLQAPGFLLAIVDEANVRLSVRIFLGYYLRAVRR